MCWMASFFVSLFSFDWFNFLQTCCYFNCRINICLIAFATLTVFANWSSVYFVLYILQYWLYLLYMQFQFVTAHFLVLSFSYILLFLLPLSVSAFMCGIYNYVRGTSNISEVYNVADIQWLQCTVHVVLFYVINVLYFDISTLRNVCAVSYVAVVCSVLMSCCRAMLSRSTLL